MGPSSRGFGAVAQLGERCNGIAEVRGSIPLGSTIPPVKCLIQALAPGRLRKVSFFIPATVLLEDCRVPQSRAGAYPGTPEFEVADGDEC